MSTVKDALDRMLVKNVLQDYVAKHGLEYCSNLQSQYASVARHIQKYADADARALCQTCKENCTEDSCKLS